MRLANQHMDTHSKPEMTFLSYFSLRDSFPNFILRRCVLILSAFFNRNRHVHAFLLGSQLTGTNYAYGFSDYDVVFSLSSKELTISNIIYIHLVNRL